MCQGWNWHMLFGQLFYNISQQLDRSHWSIILPDTVILCYAKQRDSISSATESITALNRVIIQMLKCAFLDINYISTTFFYFSVSRAPVMYIHIYVHMHAHMYACTMYICIRYIHSIMNTYILVHVYKRGETFRHFITTVYNKRKFCSVTSQHFPII